jgi:hypothetical protein
MISMAYDQHCETFRFASRKTRFVFAAFGLVDAQNEIGLKPRHLWAAQNADPLANS